MHQRLLLGSVMAAVACATLAAQQLTPVPKSLTDPVHPRRSPVEWTSSALSTTSDEITEIGPALRVAAVGDRTVLKSQLTLTHPFTVGAVFHRNTTSSANSPYGITLGCAVTAACTMAFLVRPDGTASVRYPATIESVWTTTSALHASPEAGLIADRLEVRITGTDAVFLVNGKPVSVVPVAEGELDGQPGVHVGTGGDVLVTTFSVETTSAPRPK